MIELQDIYGFPVSKNEKDGSIEIDSNCEYPQQSEECENLYQSIECVFIEEQKLNFPLNINEWKAIIEPTEENIKHYYSSNGIRLYMKQFKKRLIDTTTFFKLEVHYSKDKSLPNLILHFYEVNYKDTLNVFNTYNFSDRCFIKYNIDQLTPDRIINLGKNNINYKWIRHIPLFPVEVIKFDDDKNIKKFSHQELNKSSFTDEI
jgi:hypothetical protein